jgi:hypothetical protein
LSEQVGTAQRSTPVLSVAQTLLVQSAATEHFSPLAHFAQVPPQSTSVSVPSMTPSLHCGTAQMPLMQSMLATVKSQSVLTLQA